MGIILVIIPACLYTFGRVYWVLSVRPMHRTQHLSHVVLLSAISSSYSSVILHCINHISVFSISMLLLGHYIHISHVRYFSIYSMLRLIHYVMYFFSYILFQLYSILHASIFQVLTHTCATSSHDVCLGSQHPDDLRSVPGLQFSRINGESSLSKDNSHEFLSIFLVLQFKFFQIQLGHIPIFLVSLEDYSKHSQIHLSIQLISPFY